MVGYVEELSLELQSCFFNNSLESMPFSTTRIFELRFPNNFRPTIFESFGLSSETAILRASGAINIIQLLASMPVIFTLDVLGRRPLLLSGSVFPPRVT
jgi:Sugar (and other) transporter